MGHTKPRVGQPFHIRAGQLRKISAPTLVFLGSKDGLVGNPDRAVRRARYIENQEIEVLPDAGHIMSVDDPTTVSSRIIEFLGS